MHKQQQSQWYIHIVVSILYLVLGGFSCHKWTCPRQDVRMRFKIMRILCALNYAIAFYRSLPTWVGNLVIIVGSYCEYRKSMTAWRCFTFSCTSVPENSSFWSLFTFSHLFSNKSELHYIAWWQKVHFGFDHKTNLKIHGKVFNKFLKSFLIAPDL